MSDAWDWYIPLVNLYQIHLLTIKLCIYKVQHAHSVEINDKYLQLKKLSRNYGSARSSDADFIRKYYQEKAREHQRQKDMEDWRYRTGKYRDHEMDEAIRKENERQRQAFQNIFQSGAGRNLRNDRYWSGRYQYHYYHSSHPVGKLRRMMFHLILWTCFFSLIGTRHWYVVLLNLLHI